MPEKSGMVNKYTCRICSEVVVTVIADDGTTPATLFCTKENCKGSMFSSWYNVSQDLQPTHEWYMPENTKGLTIAEIEHRKLGGLFLRERT